MRKLLFGAIMALLLVFPAGAEDLDDFGGVKLEASAEYWVTPLVVRHAFWGMPDFPQPPVAGYVSYVAVVDDGILVGMSGMNNIWGDIFANPPERYGDATLVPWNEEFKAYGWFENTDNGLEFEVFVFDADGYGKWITGCLAANGELFPRWLESRNGIWSEWALGDIPEWRVHLRRGTKRVK